MQSDDRYESKVICLNGRKKKNCHFCCQQGKGGHPTMMDTETKLNKQNLYIE